MSLPRVTFKAKSEDFVVDEIPIYTPSGEGEHLFVHVRKRGRTTDEVARLFAQALDVDTRHVGIAGMKDKVAVTTQWLSFPARGADAEARVRAVEKDGVTVLDVGRHGNKLRTGHLEGNRFTIVLRNVPREELAAIDSAFERIAREGVPNAFGHQRFGRHGDTHERAREWLTGKARAPRDARQRRFEFSALQSAAFNAVLAHRVEDGTWTVPIEGDVLKKEETGGLFVCSDVQVDRERAARRELCPTGPIVGDRMRQPEGAALELEQQILQPFVDGIDLARARSLGEGTRRPLRLLVRDLSHSVVSTGDEAFSDRDETTDGGCAIVVRFVLPKGAYATTVLSNVFTLIEPGRDDPKRENANEEE